MKARAVFIQLMVLAIPLALLSGVVGAQTVIKVGLTLPKGLKGAAPLTGAFELFKEEVEKNSSGQLRVDIVYGGALGNEFDRLNQVRRGVIQMCDCNEATIATVYKDIVTQDRFSPKDLSIGGIVNARVAGGLTFDVICATDE